MAVTCDPKQLPAQATCFRCNTPVTNKQVQLYLFGVLSGVTSVSLLSAGAATYRPLQNKLARAAQDYLLAVATGNSTDPKVLEAAAACWACIPESERMNVSTYLLANAAGMGASNAQSLNPNIGPYNPLIPQYDQVKIYVLNILAGNLSMAAIMAGAKCFMCLSTQRLEEVYLYLICQGFNLIPTGSTYAPGTAEFDLAVLANTNYIITWGANDLSVTICGTSYQSTGAGTSIVVNTGNCTLMQFFGSFGNTRVTVKVQKVPIGSLIPIPSNFTWTYSGGNTTATWTPASALLTTELWTSTDNVNFSLVATAAANTGTITISGPTTGTLYGKIRFKGQGFPQYSGFTSVLSVNALDAAVTDWANRVVANGGAMPSNNTLVAANGLVTALKSANIWSLMRHINIYAPDSVMAWRTPFLKTVGQNDPYTVVGQAGITATLDNTGYQITSNNGGTQGAWNTGFVPNPDWTDGTYNLGMSWYWMQGVLANATLAGCGNAGALQTIQIKPLTGGTSQWLGYDVGTPIFVYSTALLAGFYSVSKTASNVLRMYFANSSNPWALTDHGTQNGNDTGVLPTIPMYLHVHNQNSTPGGYSADKFSFFCIHVGLSSAQGQALYNAVQAYRQAIGGGFV